MTDAPNNLPLNEPEKKGARQREWEKRKLAEGKCIVCGRPRGDSPYKLWCRRHGVQHRMYGRKYNKTKPTPPGKKPKGRKVYDLPVQTKEEFDRLFPAIPTDRKKKQVIDENG